MAGPAGIEPTSPSSKHGILSIELRPETGPAGGIRTPIGRCRRPLPYPLDHRRKLGSRGRTRTDDKHRMKVVH
jgi:hypothetical protein